MLSGLFSTIKHIGSDPDDNRILRQRKEVFALVVIFIGIPTTITQGVFYLVSNQRTTAIIHFIWASLDTANLTFWSFRRKNFYPTAKRTLLLALIMSFFTTVSLKGI